MLGQNWPLTGAPSVLSLPHRGAGAGPTREGESQLLPPCLSLLAPAWQLQLCSSPTQVLPGSPKCPFLGNQLQPGSEPPNASLLQSSAGQVNHWQSGETFGPAGGKEARGGGRSAGAARGALPPQNPTELGGSLAEIDWQEVQAREKPEPGVVLDVRFASGFERDAAKEVIHGVPRSSRWDWEAFQPSWWAALWGTCSARAGSSDGLTRQLPSNSEACSSGGDTAGRCRVTQSLIRLPSGRSYGVGEAVPETAFWDLPLLSPRSPWASSVHLVPCQRTVLCGSHCRRWRGAQCT